MLSGLDSMGRLVARLLRELPNTSAPLVPPMSECAGQASLIERTGTPLVTRPPLFEAMRGSALRG